MEYIDYLILCSFLFQLFLNIHKLLCQFYYFGHFALEKFALQEIFYSIYNPIVYEHINCAFVNYQNIG